MISITNDTANSGVTGIPFNRLVTGGNIGPNDAVFSTGQVIMRGQLPTGAAYSPPVIGTSTNITGLTNITCQIDLSDLFTCTATGGSVTIGANSGSLSVSFAVTPDPEGTLSTTVFIDPDSHLVEYNETNNTSIDMVTIVASATVFSDPDIHPIGNPNPDSDEYTHRYPNPNGLTFRNTHINSNADRVPI